MRWGIRDGYVERLNPAYCDDSQRAENFQQAVYDAAAGLARAYDCHTLIDIGCGQGVKLIPYFDQFKVIGIDYGANIAYCQETYNGRATWLTADLECEVPLISALTLRDSVLICADVIEHLVDPTFLLDSLRGWLEQAPAAVISTPDRWVVYGCDHDGPPWNPGHVREWLEAEFMTLLVTHGFTIRDRQHVHTSDKRSSRETMLFVVEGETL